MVSLLEQQDRTRQGKAPHNKQSDKRNAEDARDKIRNCDRLEIATNHATHFVMRSRSRESETASNLRYPDNAPEPEDEAANVTVDILVKITWFWGCSQHANPSIPAE
jgi:hypothetical protein